MNGNHPPADSREKQDDKFRMFTEAPLAPLICRLALPCIASMIVSAVYNVADTYWVGSLGTSAVGAVGVVMPLMAVVQAFGFFFGQGSGNFISRELGAHRLESAAQMSASGFFGSVISMAILAAAGLVFMRPLSLVLGATPTILPYARDYMFFILLAAPFMTGSFVLNNILRFQGSAFYGMLGMMTGAVLNMALDPLFIFGFKMGIGGAGLATALSQCASCAILLAGSRKAENIAVRARNFKPHLRDLGEMARGGAPSLLRQGLASVAAVCVNLAAGAFGDEAIAAFSIVNRVTMLAAAALIGFGQGFQPVCGFNYGAARYERVKKAFWFCVKLSAGALVVLAAVMALFAPQIITIFRRGDARLIEIGALSLRLQAITFPLTGWIVLSNMLMQTIRKPVEASILSMSRQGLFLIPALFILTPLFSLLGIQAAQPVADIASFLLAIPLTRKIMREMK